MSLAEILLASVVTSATVAGVLVFFLKHYLRSQVEWHFRRLELEYQAERRGRDQISDRYLSQRLGIYPEISQLVYQLRNAVMDGIARPNICEWNDEFPLLCGELTAGLFRWRFYLPKPLFKLLHEFKRAALDINLFYDVRTRPEELADDEAYRQGLERIRPSAEKVDRLCEEITAAINLEAPDGS